MKTAIFISGASAALIANCIRQVAQDNGVTIPDMLMDQLPNILIAAGGVLSAFLGWLAHRSDKKAQSKTIDSLLESASKAPPVSAVQKAK